MSEAAIAEPKPVEYIPTCTSMTPRGGVMRECGARTVANNRCAEHAERKSKLGV